MAFPHGLEPVGVDALYLPVVDFLGLAWRETKKRPGCTQPGSFRMLERIEGKCGEDLSRFSDRGHLRSLRKGEEFSNS